jgi:hypothetical protein
VTVSEFLFARRALNNGRLFQWHRHASTVGWRCHMWADLDVE